MLRSEGIDRGDAGDVNDRDLGAFVDNVLKEILHHDLRAFAIERADNGECKHALPQLDHRRRQFRDFAMLAKNDFFTALLILLESEQAKLIKQKRDTPGSLRELGGFNRLVAIKRVE